MEKIYNRSPLWMQNIGIAAFGAMWKHRRFGGRFKAYVDDFSTRERFTWEMWQGYQIEKLRELLRVCYFETPYYQCLFNDCGINETTIRNFSLDDLQKLPLLEKNTIRENRVLHAHKPKHPWDLRIRHLRNTKTCSQRRIAPLL